MTVAKVKAVNTRFYKLLTSTNHGSGEYDDQDDEEDKNGEHNEPEREKKIEKMNFLLLQKLCSSRSGSICQVIVHH